MSQTGALQPVDVRIMNATASAVFMAVFLLLLAAVVMWALRNPAFAIGRIVVSGAPQHSSALALQTNVIPKLQGNLFTLDLETARQAFEQMPWVRSATISRVFPGTLQVQLEEHVPVAYWEEGPSGSFLVNSFGEVFEANRGEVEHESMPSLSGPREQSQQVLGMYRHVEPLLAAHAFTVNGFFMNSRGNWQVVLGNNGLLELGAGSPEEVGWRVQRFLLSLPEALRPMQRTANALEYADLRHRNGYAIRLKGVVTGEGAAQAQRQSAPARR